MRRLLDFFFPRFSLAGSEGEWVTRQEREILEKLRPVILSAEELRSSGMQHLDGVVAAAAYDASPLLKIAIHRCKYRGIRPLARELGALLSRAAEFLERDAPPVLCPVPLHWTRRFRRGFNQSEILADRVAWECGYPVRCLLRRVRATGFQSHRQRADRVTALRGAFSVIADTVPDHVILVDDLCTTGATLDACAEALKKAGVKRVEGLVVARG